MSSPLDSNTGTPDGTTGAPDQALDLTGLTCPMPLLKAKQALNRMASGQLLQVLATDPGSWRDFQVFAEQSGHLLEQATAEDGRYTYLLRCR